MCSFIDLAPLVMPLIADRPRGDVPAGIFGIIAFARAPIPGVFSEPD